MELGDSCNAFRKDSLLKGITQQIAMLRKFEKVMKKFLPQITKELKTDGFYSCYVVSNLPKFTVWRVWDPRKIIEMFPGNWERKVSNCGTFYEYKSRTNHGFEIEILCSELAPQPEKFSL